MGAVATMETNDDADSEMIGVYNKSKTGLSIMNGEGSAKYIYYLAWGY